MQVREIITWELTRRLLSLGYKLEDSDFKADYSLEMSEDKKCFLLPLQLEAEDKSVLDLVYDLLTP